MALAAFLVLVNDISVGGGVAPVSLGGALPGSGVLSAIDRFRRDQRALRDMGSTRAGLSAIESANKAEGDDLATAMQEQDMSDEDALTRNAVRASSGAIRGAGLRSGGGAGLFGYLTGSEVAKGMSLGGTPDKDTDAALGVSLKQELEASRKELADVAAGGDGRKYLNEDMGISESALNSVTQGMLDGLHTRRYSPLTGLSTGALELAPSAESTRLAQRELRRVAGGELPAQASLTGLVGRSVLARLPRAARAVDAAGGEFAALEPGGAAGDPPPPPSRTKWTRLVHPSVLTGHVSSLSCRTTTGGRPDAQSLGPGAAGDRRSGAATRGGAGLGAGAQARVVAQLRQRLAASRAALRGARGLAG